MILDHTDGDEDYGLTPRPPTDDIDIDADDDIVGTDWLDGLQRAGLPVRRHVAAEMSPGAVELLGRALAPSSSAGVRQLAENSIAPSTRDKYEQDWSEFAAWARLIRGLEDPLSASELDVVEYVLHLVQSRVSISTVNGRLAAVAFFTIAMRGISPTHSELVRRVVKGARRTVGTARRQAAPLRLGEMRHIVRGLPIVHDARHSMRRDQLLIGLGWAGALRPDELVGLDVDDVSFVGDPDIGDGGLLLRIRRSKTDQERRVQWVAVPYASEWASCPVRLTLAYTRRLRTGPLFRGIDRHGKLNGRLHPDSISRTLKPYIGELLQADASLYSGQSLRAGFVTEARTHGVDDTLIARHTRHTLPGQRRGSTLDIYDRPTQLFERSPFTGWY